MSDIELEARLNERIKEIALDGDLLAVAIRDVIYQGRRAERKLWHEYRADDPLAPNIDPTESYAEGEALHHALNDLEALLPWAVSDEL